MKFLEPDSQIFQQFDCTIAYTYTDKPKVQAISKILSLLDKNAIDFNCEDNDSCCYLEADDLGITFAMDTIHMWHPNHGRLAYNAVLEMNEDELMNCLTNKGSDSRI